MSTQKILLDYGNSWNSPKLFSGVKSSKKEWTEKHTWVMQKELYDKLGLQ